MSMAERARGLQGDFALRSAPGQGTVVEVRW
jgi:signal transduction histidine kinase